MTENMLLASQLIHLVWEGADTIDGPFFHVAVINLQCRCNGSVWEVLTNMVESQRCQCQEAYFTL